MANLNLGDSEFNKKLYKLYSWIMPVVYGSMMILFLVAGAILTSFLFAIGLIITLPPLKKYMDRIHIKGTIKVILCVVLIVLAIFSTGVYL